MTKLSFHLFYGGAGRKHGGAGRKHGGAERNCFDFDLTLLII